MTSSRAFVKPSVPNASVRLQKALADAGIAARRDCELLILKGRVHVNGREVRALPCFVDSKNDVVTFDGVPVDISTEPLWGVGSTPPYGHDGRSINLREVILRHGGEAKASRDLFAAMPDISKTAIMEFLNSLVLFPPDDTASNLDPGDPNAPGYPQRGHGSIRLPVLFNDPTDLE
jgi:hypothetical protein